MSNAKVVFDSIKNKWVGVIGTRIVVRSASKDYVERKLQETGVNLEVVSDKPKVQFSVTERFGFINQFVTLVSLKKLNSFILTGSGGLGKTYSVIEGLKKSGKKEDKDFVVIRGYSTAKALYRNLFENNGKVIIFDDADSVHKDAVGANILKAALGSEDRRMISWNSERAESDDLPSRFQFTGRVIFISNLSQDQFPQAIISRSMKVDLTLNTEEKVERIVEVFKSIKAEVTVKDEVLTFIKKYADEASDLNIRSALAVLKLRQDIGANWERLALYNFVG